MARSLSSVLPPATAPSPEGAGEEVFPEHGAPGPSGPGWKVHDRTHIECGLHWSLDPLRPVTELEWDAYFFVPESLRLDARSYPKQDIYNDLRSYVRLAVPDASFATLGGQPLDHLAEAVDDGESERAVYEMRFFAGGVRAASSRARMDILRALDQNPADETALREATQLIEDMEQVTARMRRILDRGEQLPEPSPTAARWVDEDVSRMVETLAGELALAVRRGSPPSAVAGAAARAAAREARHRRDRGLRGVVSSDVDKRDIEHLEFRRHVLKRFTASALWLDATLRDPTRWAVHLTYAVAAGVAMAFAVVAAVLNGLEADPGRLWMWGAIAVLAYMAKDRIKAGLQGAFSKYVSSRFADRRWIVSDTEKGRVLGRADERTLFVPFEEVPEAVLSVRRSTRIHALEEEARPETVLWHHKDVLLHPGVIARVDPRVDAMREILRLDLRHWLAHTDDPKRRIVFADPDSGEICAATAPRVYNIGIVYRLRSKDEPDAPWHRVRVVVTRKGIRRIDRVR